jgi:hypothetical protein
MAVFSIERKWLANNQESIDRFAGIVIIVAITGD